MTLPNYERMLRLADEFFSVRTDPEQLNVTPEVIERLKRLHPATLSDHSTTEGPVVWILLIPTVSEVMEHFLDGRVSEARILDLTPEGASYDALYLCSALVLPEYRRRGLALKVAAGAVEAIRRDHPIATLFYWGFSAEGRRLAEAVARAAGLPLRVRR